jgi:hypothetical protein
MVAARCRGQFHPLPEKIMGACRPAGEGNPRHGSSVPGISVPTYGRLVTPTLFHEPWWLEIATAGRYDVVEVCTGRRVVGCWPYARQRRHGLLVSEMPPLTWFLGPLVAEGDGPEATCARRRMALTRQLIRALPAFAAFRQKCHGGVTDAIAFQAEGFEVGVQFTYELAPLPVEALWRAMRDKRRNAIRNAARRFTATPMEDPAELRWLYLRNLQRQRRESVIDIALAERLMAACQARGRGRALAARDAAGAAVAAIACVWDAVASYYWLSTRDPEAAEGAISLLLWEAIQEAARAGRVFDFAGLAHAGMINLYASFGGTARPRYVVSRRHPALRLAQAMLRPLRGAPNPFDP